MLDILTAELERLFSTSELAALVESHLALEPEALKLSRGKAAFVKNLVDHAAQHALVETLADIVVLERPACDERIRSLRDEGFTPSTSLAPGESLGDYSVEAKLGEGPDCEVYRVRRDGKRMRLRLVGPRAAASASAVQRYFAASRAAGLLQDKGLPHGVEAGELNGRAYVLHPLIEGLPLLSQMGRAQKLRQAWPVLREILESLAALHVRRLSHGALHPNNVLVVPSTDGARVVLLDTGAHLLRREALQKGGTRHTALAMPLRYAAPEQLLGDLPTPRSDVYAFGLVLYAILTGKPAFAGTPREALRQRFSTSIEPLSFAAPRGSVGPDLDELVLQLLDDSPDRRLPDADAVLEALEPIASYSTARDSTFPDADFDTQLERLLADPAQEMAAAVLEASIDQGAEPRRVAEAFCLAAEMLESEDDRNARRRLLQHAGRLYETVVGDAKAAAHTYELLLSLDRNDPTAWTLLEQAYKRLGNYDALVELLLEHAEGAATPEDRSRLFARMGDLLSTKLQDIEQARVAYAQALVETPQHGEYAEVLERLTGSNRSAWAEVLETCAQAAGPMTPGDAKNALLTVMGGWYQTRLARPDLALQCYQAVVMSAPADDVALERIAEIYRNAQQWRELAEVLELRADAAVAPALGRDLKVEAANLRLLRLGDGERASSLLERVLEEDPSHAEAARTLAALYLNAGDLGRYVQVMQQRASATSGEHRIEVLTDLAKVQVERLGNVNEAVALYEQVLKQSPNDLEALKQLEAAYSATGKSDRLREILERQLELAVTPRQKVTLLERIARLRSDEFLDLEGATLDWERILELEAGHQEALASLVDSYRKLERWSTLAWTLERRAEAASSDEIRKQTLLDLGVVVTKKLGEAERAVDVYERVVAIDPTNTAALDALASLRADLGDETRAADALDHLAERESDPRRRADHLVRAGEIVERRGDLPGAVGRYGRALEAVPTHVGAARRLARAHEALGDTAQAIEVLEQTSKLVEREAEAVELSVELARILKETGEVTRARTLLRVALDHQPSNTRALLLLGDVEYDAGSHEQAAQAYAAVVDVLDELAPERRAEILHRHAIALHRFGQSDRAREMLERLDALAEDLETTQRCAELAFTLGDPSSALRHAKGLLDRYGPQLTGAQLSQALYWEGESLRRTGKGEQARAYLERAALTDKTADAPLRALASFHREQSAWQELDKTLTELAQRLAGEARAAVLVERGDLAAQQLGDSNAAVKHYLAGLAENPGDRRTLLKLMDLHSRGRDWKQLLGDIEKLVELTDDRVQQAKYLQTAARVAALELDDGPRTLTLLQRALDLDPQSEALVREALELRSKFGDTEGVRELLESQIRKAAASMDRDTALRLATELADLHLQELHLDDAIAVNEMALKLAGHDPNRASVLVELYATDPVRYLDRAVKLERAEIHRDPFQPEPYRMLRKLYADAKRRDATWVCCQALSILGSTTPDEALFFKRHRRTAPVPAGTRITEDDFRELVVHPDADPLLTRVFATIQHVIAVDRGRPLEQLGFRESDALDPAKCPGTLVRNLELASDALRIPLPMLLLDDKAKAPLAMRPTARRALFLSGDGVRAKLPELRSAFVAGAHVAYFRAGFWVRVLVPSLLGLKAWMLAAVKLLAPRLPIAAELEGAVNHARDLLEKQLTGPLRDKLADPVDDLLRRGGRADVGKWTMGVDLTSDRIGLILADDLSTVLKTISATGDEAAAATATQRTQALVEYSVSREYLTLRDRLRLSLDWRELEELDLDRDGVDVS